MAKGGSKMNKYFIACIALLVLFISGCSDSSQVKNSDLKEYEVQKTIDEQVQGDFVFRLVSEKKEYQEGNDVKLYGKIIYTGEKEEITIHHSSSAIFFPMEEKVRGYTIGFAVSEIGLSTVLKRDVPYREEYQKNIGYIEDDPREYVSFIENFLDRDDFPLGYYVVNGETDFSVEGQERINIKATVDFKVVE